jgi:hypothetical protein
LVAAGGLGLADADNLLGRDADEAIFEAEHRLQHPDPGDNPWLIKRDIARLKGVQRRREEAWDETTAAADYELDAVLTYATAAPPEPLARPTTTQAEAAATVEAALAQAIHGEAFAPIRSWLA